MQCLLSQLSNVCKMKQRGASQVLRSPAALPFGEVRTFVCTEDFIVNFKLKLKERKDSVRTRAYRSRGFTLLETIMALAVLAIGVTGALGGLIQASHYIRAAQTRHVKMMLLDAKTQRLWLANKTALFSSAVTRPSMFPEQIAIGTTPWVSDTSAAGFQDLGTGRYFTVSDTGRVNRITISGNPACGNAAIPKGTFCRETFVMSGAPVTFGTNAAMMPSVAQVITVWTRVSRMGEPASLAVVNAEVLVQ